MTQGDRQLPWRVLIVDDDEQIRSLLSHYLKEREEGFDIATAGDGQEALDILHTGEFDADAVLIDLSMPGMGGFETLRRIDEEFDHLVTIVLSGRDSEDDQLRAFDLGALDFVRKPFSPEVLTARLERRLERTEALKHTWPEPWQASKIPKK